MISQGIAGRGSMGVRYGAAVVLWLLPLPPAAQAAWDTLLYSPHSRSRCIDLIDPDITWECLQLDRPIAPDAEARRTAGAAMLQARDLLARRQPAAAEAALGPVVADYPRLWFPLQLRAHARRQLGDQVGALVDLEEALRSSGRRFNLLADRCSVRWRLGDAAGAIEDCTAALGSEFQVGTALYALIVHAAVAMARGDLDAAESSVNRMLRGQGPGPVLWGLAPAWRLRGWILTLRGDALAANAAVRTAREASPGVEADLADLIGHALPAPPAIPAPPRPPPRPPPRR